jgi:hyperosmotically inducible protein
MRNQLFFLKSVLASSVVMAFAVLPLSQVMAQDKMGSSPPSSSSSANETVSDKTDDSWITTKVKSELLDTKNVKSTDISVTTTEGVVALSGTVTSAREKIHVIHVTKLVKGVKSVDASALSVVPAGSAGGSQ